MSTVLDPPVSTGLPDDDPPAKRSTSRDGVANRVELLALTNGGVAWRAAQRWGPTERLLNRFLINRAVNRTPARPYQFSTKSSITSWDSLTDKTFNARQLPGTATVRTEPATEQVVALFERSAFVECTKSTVLFAYFAQWFTDGFLRTRRSKDGNGPRDIRRNISNHEVDLMQLYGSDRCQTCALRAPQGGRLKSIGIDGAEFPPRLCGDDGEPLAAFRALSPVVGFGRLTVEQKRELFAMGSDVANVQVGYAMFNVLFLREHNRIAGVLEKSHPDWDDEQLFQTARNILIVLLIKLAIEEYINHITPYHFKFRFHPSSFYKSPWQRPNWECVEFNLLYRWHSMLPDQLRIGGGDVPLARTAFNNAMITRCGLGRMFEDASLQAAGKVRLFNTPRWLAEQTSRASIEESRKVKLASFNAYRTLCGYPPIDDLRQISSSGRVVREVGRRYDSARELELYVGLFAEDVRPNSVLPPLMGRLVGVHAFSQLMTNPLLAPLVYNAETFSPEGKEIIESTASLEQLVHRNVPGDSKPYVSLTRKSYRRERTSLLRRPQTPRTRS